MGNGDFITPEALHVATDITLLRHVEYTRHWVKTADVGWGKGGGGVAELAPRRLAASDRSQHSDCMSSRQQRSGTASSYHRQPSLFLHQLTVVYIGITISTNRPWCAQASAETQPRDLLRPLHFLCT